MDSDLSVEALENLFQNLPSRITNSNGSNNQLHSTPNQNNSAGAVIAKIEDIFESMVDCIHDKGKELVIPLKTRRKAGMQTHDAASGVIESLPDATVRNITFPSRNPKEAWRFTALFRILELSHEALVNGVVTTKRDIYYRDPGLFLKQAVVDRYVDDIAYTFGVDRDSLNVVAAAKGLIAGSFQITRKDLSSVDYATEIEGTLIPSLKEIQDINSDARWILVIEKEATFRTLATTQYWRDSQAGKGILITAKGYPDIQTRQFLHFVSSHYPSIPILALVDYDPDGIGIVSTYKYGSISLAHQNATLAVPKMQWLGVRSVDVMSKIDTNRGLLRLTARDRRIATRMLDKEIFQEEEWRREVQVMLMLNVKAEIQILSEMEGLEEWLDEKLVDAVA